MWWNEGLGAPMRKKIGDRDGHYCWTCKASVKARLTIHHVIFRSEGGTNDLSNLILLCKPCHRNRAHGVHMKLWQKVFRAYLLMRHEAEKYDDIKGEPPCTLLQAIKNWIKTNTQE